MDWRLGRKAVLGACLLLMFCFIYEAGLSFAWMEELPYGTDYTRSPLDASIYTFNSRSLRAGLKEMHSDRYMIDNYLTINDANLFKYEFYALNPDVTLCYSPRFIDVGYEGSDCCTGYNVKYISEESGQQKYNTLLSVTEPKISSLKNRSNKVKIRETGRWIKKRYSYTDTLNNMWDMTLYGCLVKGSATCLGYSQGFLYMMNRLHVPCRIVCSKYHAWNVVYDGEKWIKVDLTKG